MILLRYFAQAAFSIAAYFAIYAAWWSYLRTRPDSAGYRSSFHLLLAAALIWAQIYVVVLALGLLGWLDRALVLAVNAGITFYLLARLHPSARTQPGTIIPRPAGSLGT